MHRRTFVKGLASTAAAAAVGARVPAIGRAQSPDPATIEYDFVDLGGAPGIARRSAATAISESGIVVGWADVSLDPLIRHAVLWENGAMVDLGPPDFPFTEAAAINAGGIVAGRYLAADLRHYGSYWDAPGRMFGLQSTVMGNSIATGINDQNHVIGYTESLDRIAHALLWRGAEVIDLGSLGGDGSAALAINNAGQIVGYAALPAQQEGWPPSNHAFLWTDGVMTDLGTLPGGGASVARAVNASGVAAGYSGTEGGNFEFRAVLWKDGAITELGTLEGPSSDAFGLNDDGVAVGEAFVNEFSRVAARFAHGAVTDLNTVVAVPGDLKLAQATDINNGGFICGFAHPAGVSGDSRAYLLVPRTAATPVS